MEELWDKDTLSTLTVPATKPLAQSVMEQTMEYGIRRSEVPGLISTILGGNIPDNTMKALMTKNIRELSQMTVEELESLPGIAKAKAVRLAAAFELSRRLSSYMPAVKPVIRSPVDAANLVLEEMRQLDREHFKAIMVNTKRMVITVEDISVGTLSRSLVHPRELFKNAIKRSAAALILIHNHPTGDTTPSQEDIDITKRLIEAGNIIGIDVMDHIIIGDGRFVSLKEKGIM